MRRIGGRKGLYIVMHIHVILHLSPNWIYSFVFSQKKNSKNINKTAVIPQSRMFILILTIMIIDAQQQLQFVIECKSIGQKQSRFQL